MVQATDSGGTGAGDRRACQIYGHGQGTLPTHSVPLLDALKIEQFREPKHEIINIGGTLSDEEATKIVREVMNELTSGSGGKKVLLQVDPVQS